MEEEEGLLLTPFERNLEVWRQLWRVLERSDIVVQVRQLAGYAIPTCNHRHLDSGCGGGSVSRKTLARQASLRRRVREQTCQT